MTASSLAGRTIAGRYEVFDLLGVGGMGEVYRARDRELDELVALKMIRANLLAQPGAHERFRNEVKLARRVTHRNVARAYELVVTPDATFYTMELIEGVSLARKIRGGRRLNVADAVAVAIEVCDALATAHAAGVIHRDVKPENILVADDGRVVLTDFGIAAASHGSAELAGTPRYMAPEQALGAEPSQAVDIYALGVVLYELLAGRPAFAGADLAEIDANKQRVEHLQLDGVDDALNQVLARATARDPAARFHSATALRRALAPFARERAPTRPSGASMQRPAALPTLVIRRAEGVAANHLLEGIHQALVDRLAEWPRLRVVTRAPDDRTAEGLVDLRVNEDELEVTATARPQSLVLRLPFDVESIPRSTERTARVLAALMGSDAAPPPHHDRPMPAAALDLVLRARHVVRRDRGRLAEAVAWCESALDLAPHHPRVEATLATCQAQLAFYLPRAPEALLDAATGHALAAVARAPQLADAHFARAHVELQRGRPISAAVCFRAAIGLAPLWAEAHEWLGRLLLEAGFTIDAQGRFDQAISLGDLPALRWELAIAAALDGRWQDVDAIVAALDAVGSTKLVVQTGLGYRLRLASWRNVRDDDVFRAFASLGEADTFEHGLVVAIHDPALPWQRKREMMRTAVSAGSASARRRGFVAQLAAEAAGATGDIDECLTFLLRANSCGLFDLRWLDHCPLLAPVRAEPRFAIIRADVAERALAIHDALFGDHRDEATIVTALAGQ